MDNYRYCLLGPSGRVDVVRECECASLEDAQRVARRVLRTDLRWIGIELWQGDRRVHVEFRQSPRHAGPRRVRLRPQPAQTEALSGPTPGHQLVGLSARR
jgi:hypothetical protein